MSNPAAVLSRQNPMREETVLYRGWRVCEGLDNSSGTAVGTRRPSEQEGCHSNADSHLILPSIEN